MDEEAKVFIVDMYQQVKRRGGPILLVIWSAFIGPLVYFWIFLPFPKSLNVFYNRLFIALVFGPPITVPLLIMFQSRLNNLKKDTLSDHLTVTQGEYEKCLSRGGCSGLMSKEQVIKFNKKKLIVPVSIWLKLPDKGNAKIEYFPHTRWCWKINNTYCYKMGENL